jgi:hypothetical protein
VCARDAIEPLVKRDGREERAACVIKFVMKIYEGGSKLMKLLKGAKDCERSSIKVRLFRLG